MNKLISFCIIAGMLTGCASQKMVSIYQIEGVELAQSISNVDTLNKYSITRSGPVSKSSLTVCVAQELNNSPVVLASENVNSWDDMNWYGMGWNSWWWRPYYRMPSLQTMTVGGGNTIKLIEGNSIIANAIASYQYDTNYFVNYTLTITYTKNNTHYLFNNIRQAQQYTGFGFNNGFGAVSTYERDHPDLVLKVLDMEADKVQNCLLQR